MGAMMIVIRLEICKLSLQVNRVPEKGVVKKLTADGSNDALNEGMRNRCIRDGLNLIYTKNPQVRLPLVIQE